MSHSRILTIPQIAKKAGYTRRHMARLCRNGRFPFKPVKWSGKQKRFAYTPALEKWCESSHLARRKATDSGSALDFRPVHKLFKQYEEHIARRPLTKWSRSELEQTISQLDRLPKFLAPYVEQMERRIKQLKRQT